MPQLYARVFVQALDSSLADDWQVRHVFEDMLKLVNQDGVVDMTASSIARRTNVPLEIVQRAIGVLESPDPNSRDQSHDGRRITLLDDHRDWGWRILNWQKYEAIRMESDMREFNAARMRHYRAKASPPQTPPQNKTDSDTDSDTDTGRSPQVPTRSTTKFVKPTVEELKLACAKMGLPESEAERFWHYYETNGWVVTKARTPMKKWQSALVTWKTHWEEWRKNGTVNQSSGRKPDGSPNRDANNTATDGSEYIKFGESVAAAGVWHSPK